MSHVDIDAQPLQFPQTGQEMLTAMCGQYSHTLSDFEALMWGTQVLGVYSDEQIIRACMAHMEGPAPDRNFMPRYGSIKAIIDPAPGVLEIEHLVRTGSPYASPNINDPLLVEAISQLGGWERVCAELPDAREQPFEFSQYIKRIERAMTGARKRVQVDGAIPARALGIVDRMRIEQSTTIALEAPSDTPRLSMRNVP